MKKFSINIVSRGRNPADSRQEIWIDESGQGLHQFSPDQAGSQVIEEKFKLRKKDIRQIRKAAKKNRFFKMASVDTGLLDGEQLQVFITSGKKKHGVTMTNGSTPRFLSLLKKVNKTLPAWCEIFSNELQKK